MAWWRKLLDRLQQVPARTGVTHDYTRPCWGRVVFAIEHQSRWNLYGFGPFAGRIAAGDWIVTTTASGDTTRWRVEAIEYQHDPPDMWFARVRDDAG